MTPTLDLDSYLPQLKHDVNHRLWDLLYLHLAQARTRIDGQPTPLLSLPTIPQATLVNTLDEALTQLNKNHAQTKLYAHPRLQLLLLNLILHYKPQRADLKTLKKDVLKQIAGNDPDLQNPNPLAYQIAELKYTQDTTHLRELIPAFLEQKWYGKALYLLQALTLLEPHDPQVKAWKERLAKEIPPADVTPQDERLPQAGKLLLLDDELAIPFVFHDLKGYDFGEKKLDVVKLAKGNRFLIPQCVLEEVERHAKRHLEELKTKAKTDPTLDVPKIEKALQERLNHVTLLYTRKIPVTDEQLKKVHDFYHARLPALEKILRKQLDKAPTLARKLARLTKRIDCLPEPFDQRLLAEAAVLTKQEKEGAVAILTTDYDFQAFAKDIHQEFHVHIYTP